MRIYAAMVAVLPLSSPMSEAIYERRTVRCSFDGLALAGPAPAIGKVSEGLGVALDLVFGGGESTLLKPAPIGLRLAGEYGTQSGFDLEFQSRGVVVGCGDAVVARDYSVQVQGAQVAVKVQHGATPLRFALRPDGTLVGSGTVEVSGRVVAGTSPSGELAYAPVSVGTPSGVSGAGNPGGAGATAMLSLTSGFPTPAASPNPIGGRMFFLLKGSMETILTTAGVKATAGSSALLAWQASCQKQAPECQKALQAVLSNSMGVVKTDVAGKAQFPSVVPGTYYLFGAGSVNGRDLLWNLRVELKAGANAVTLDQRTASPGS